LNANSYSTLTSLNYPHSLQNGLTSKAVKLDKIRFDALKYAPLLVGGGTCCLHLHLLDTMRLITSSTSMEDVCYLTLEEEGDLHDNSHSPLVTDPLPPMEASVDKLFLEERPATEGRSMFDLLCSYGAETIDGLVN
jgi:hypothetical protein